MSSKGEVMQESKQFPKITFELTPEQLETLAPFADAVNRGFASRDGTDTRCAVLGNVWLARGTNKVDCFLIQTAEFRTINAAIVKAQKQLK